MGKEGVLFTVIFLLILAATATGIVSSTNSLMREATDIRGQKALYQDSGVYRYNPASFVREGVIWDVVNLFIGLPLFAIAAIGSLQNRLRSRLFMGGLLAYFWYVYLGSVVMYAFNRFFLVYIAIFSLSMVAFVLNFQHVKVPELPPRMGRKFPRRLFIAYSTGLGVVLTFLWLVRLVPIMFSGQFPEEFAGLLTFGSQALDLGFIVPLVLATAALLAKKSPWGFYLASVAMPVGLMMFISIPAWITVPLVHDGKTNILEAIPFFAISLLGLVLAAIFYLNVNPRMALPEEKQAAL